MRLKGALADWKDDRGFGFIEPAQEAQTPAFQCDGRTYCSQMNSRVEAEFFVKHCPGTKMDGNNDGEPCENDSRF